MTTYRVIIQPNAEAELETAYLYRHARAPQAAARWFAGLVEAINSLERFPRAVSACAGERAFS